MFGYVLPPLERLSQEEQDRFRAMYCGLCRCLGQRCGESARMILNYDFTYLAILLSGRDAGEEREGRCLPHPVRARPYLAPTPAMELAADESVILAYWQLRDGVADSRGGKRAKYRLASAAPPEQRWPLWQEHYGFAAVPPGEEGARLAQTLGTGPAGLEREGYFAGWELVGQLLAEGRSFADIARLPAEDAAPALRRLLA